MKETCIYCKEEFDSDELEKHQFVCVSSYKCDEIDFSNKIPCEVCNELIDFDNYDRHINICTSQEQLRPFLNRFAMFNRANILFPILTNNNSINANLDNGNENIQENENNDNNSDNMDVETDDEMPPLEPIVENENENDNENNLNFNIQQNINMVNFNLNLINNLLNNNPYHNVGNSDNYESLSQLDMDVKKEGLDINKVSEIIDSTEEKNCPICFDDFQDTTLRKLKCSHIFCQECLVEWLSENKKCPVCMIEL